MAYLPTYLPAWLPTDLQRTWLNGDGQDEPDCDDGGERTKERTNVAWTRSIEASQSPLSAYKLGWPPLESNELALCFIIIIGREEPTGRPDRGTDGRREEKNHHRLERRMW